MLSFAFVLTVLMLIITSNRLVKNLVQLKFAVMMLGGTNFTLIFAATFTSDSSCFSLIKDRGYSFVGGDKMALGEDVSGVGHTCIALAAITLVAAIVINLVVPAQYQHAAPRSSTDDEHSISLQPMAMTNRV